MTDEDISTGNGKIQNSIKVEAVKSEENIPNFNDEQIKLWTHSEDSKCHLLVHNSDIAKSETHRVDEDYDVFSSGEKGDEIQAQADHSPP